MDDVRLALLGDKAAQERLTERARRIRNTILGGGQIG